MARIPIQKCLCIDFPCCGCGRGEVLTGADALEAIREEEEAAYAEPDFCDCDCEDYDGPEDHFRDDVEADADVLRSAGMGVDEDYGCFGDCDTPLGDMYGGE